MNLIHYAHFDINVIIKKRNERGSIKKFIKTMQLTVFIKI